MRSVYGRERTGEILGQCGNKAILRLESPDTARWAAQLFGKHEAEVQSISVSEGKGSSSSHSLSSTAIENVLPSELLNLPPTSRAQGLSGYYHSPVAGNWFSKQRGGELDRLLCNRSAEPNFAGRPIHEQILKKNAPIEEKGNPLLEIG